MLRGRFAGAGEPAAPNREPVRRHRSLLSRAVTVISAAVLAMVVGAVLTLATARVTTVPAGFLAVGAVSSAAVWGIFTGRYGGRPGPPPRGTLTGLGALLAAGVLVAILLPVADRTVPAPAPPGAGPGPSPMAPTCPTVSCAPGRQRPPRSW